MEANYNVESNLRPTGRDGVQSLLQPDALVIGSELTTHTTLKTLDFRKSDLGSDGTYAVGKGLLDAKESCVANLRYDSFEVNPGGGLVHGTTTLSLSGKVLHRGERTLLAGWLRWNSTLTSLTMQGVGFDDETACHLAEALAGSPCKLKTLDMSGNNIAVKGAVEIGGMLKKMSSIRELNLSSNQLCGRVKGESGLGVMTTQFTFTYNPAGIKAICESISSGQLTSVDLGDNGLAAETEYISTKDLEGASFEVNATVTFKKMELIVTAKDGTRIKGAASGSLHIICATLDTMKAKENLTHVGLRDATLSGAKGPLERTFTKAKKTYAERLKA